MNIQSIEITPAILKLIAEIDEFKGSWRAYENLAPERLEALRRVATIESVASSTRIEGVKLTDREVENLIMNLKQHQFKTRDEQEVAGYADVMQMIYESFDSISLTENHIKQLHKVLLKYSDKDVRHYGEYKKLSNNVEAFSPEGKSLGIIFETTTPFDTPKEMTDLIAWTNASFADDIYHPLLIIAIFVVRFLAIHPFQDGNGRLSRILTTLLLLRAKYVYVPYSSMESVIEHNKDHYYLALRRTQTTLKTESPLWEPWLLFFFRTLKQQKDNLLQKVGQEEVLMRGLPMLSAQIMELAKNRGRISIAEIIQLTGAKRGTIRSHLIELVRKKLLEQHGKGRATWYTLKR